MSWHPVSPPTAASDPLDRCARAAAFEAVGRLPLAATPRVGYRSQGRLLIIGSTRQALAVATVLNGGGLRCYVLATGEGISRAQGDIPLLLVGQGARLRVNGHLGNFTVWLDTDQAQTNLARAFGDGGEHFDLLLDLSEPPLLHWEVLPLGYYAPRGDEAALHRALVELPEQVGEFEKATFFQLDPSLCAHSRRGLHGCRRCLDACPTGAIRPAGDSIAVDSYYCQGAGSCATACPTGAIVYSYPYPTDTLERLRVLLRAYREAGGSDPVLLFHDSHRGRERLDALGDRWPGQVIAIELEELGSIGLETWLAALAYGADRLVLLATPPLPPSVRRELIEQLAVAHALLTGLGYPATALRWLDAPDDDTALLTAVTSSEGLPVRQPAGFTGSNRKRDTLHYALDALAAGSPLRPDIIPLPPRAPFGEVQVNRAVCTLCMACVTVCPGKALHDGGDSPRLQLLEADCVQCGLCAVACPEHAITLQPRFLNDVQQRRQRRLLHEEPPFCCIACGKPFATHRLIETMTAKLQDHPIFREAAALRRLQMCGDCRVRDLLGDAGSN